MGLVDDIMYYLGRFKLHSMRAALLFTGL